jgi:hypothetical protein
MLREAPPGGADLDAAKARLAALDEDLQRERRRSEELEEINRRHEIDVAVREKYAEDTSSAARELSSAAKEGQRQVLRSSFVQHKAPASPGYPMPTDGCGLCMCSLKSARTSSGPRSTRRPPSSASS